MTAFNSTRKKFSKVLTNEAMKEIGSGMAAIDYNINRFVQWDVPKPGVHETGKTTMVYGF